MQKLLLYTTLTNTTTIWAWFSFYINTSSKRRFIQARLKCVVLVLYSSARDDSTHSTQLIPLAENPNVLFWSRAYLNRKNAF